MSVRIDLRFLTYVTSVVDAVGVIPHEPRPVVLQYPTVLVPALRPRLPRPPVGVGHLDPAVSPHPVSLLEFVIRSEPRHEPGCGYHIIYVYVESLVIFVTERDRFL